MDGSEYSEGRPTHNQHSILSETEFKLLFHAPWLPPEIRGVLAREVAKLPYWEVLHIEEEKFIYIGDMEGLIYSASLLRISFWPNYTAPTTQIWP